jgi:predicted dinucleotide-binding enzyme
MDETTDLVNLIPGLRPVVAGTLSMAGAIEAFTAVLLNVNVRHKARSAVKLTGL